MNNVRVGDRASSAALYLYFGFKTFTAAISLTSIYLGYDLFILGVTGKASLSVDAHSVKGQLVNAAPGLFFAVGGIATLIVIVFKGVKVTFQDDGKLSALNAPRNKRDVKVE